MIVIGLMSGTSVDAIDAVILDIQGAPPTLQVKQLSAASSAIAPDLREAVFRVLRPETGAVDKVCELNFALGEAFAGAALRAIQEAGMEPSGIDLIASAGQTVWHAVRPDQTVDSTLQLGEPAVIAERTGVTVIGDLRVRDVAAGGHGAPMVSFSEYWLYRHPQRTRALQNIGGIGNVTMLPTGEEPVTAFDTGPGNMIIDYVAGRATGGQASFDRNGAMASEGRVHPEFLANLLEHPYYGLRPPKTTGRELFGDQYGEQVWRQGMELGLTAHDIIATVTALTAASIARAYREFLSVPLDEVIVGGGGSYNPVLMAHLRDELAPVPVLTQEDLGFSSKSKEATAFAIMGYESLHGRAANLPSATHARRPVPMGKIVPGDNYLDLMRHALCASREEPC